MSDSVTERTAGAQVAVIRLRIGKLSGVAPDAVRTRHVLPADAVHRVDRLVLVAVETSAERTVEVVVGQRHQPRPVTGLRLLQRLPQQWIARVRRQVERQRDPEHGEALGEVRVLAGRHLVGVDGAQQVVEGCPRQGSRLDRCALGRRGYSVVDPRNCYKGGQSMNCRHPEVVSVLVMWLVGLEPHRARVPRL